MSALWRTVIYVLGYTIGFCTGRASARGPGRAEPGFNYIVRAGPGAGLKLAGPGRARAGK